MIDATNIMQWVGPTLDVAAVTLLAAVLWRLGREPGAAWREREGRLQAIFDDLRALVAQSEGLARDLDGKLAAREERLHTLLAQAQAAVSARPVTANAPPPAPRSSRIEVREEEPQTTAQRIEELADAGAQAEDIARRLGVAIAEVRLVIGLKAARAARQRVMPEAVHA